MQRFSTGHSDLISAIDYNFYGTRMVTAGADHLLKVWTRDESTEEWLILDTWLAHDAEVTDVKWTYPFVGEHIGSIGEDNVLKIWREDVNHAPNSSRRFTEIFSMTTSTGVPFMCLDFKSIASETYLAAVTRDGRLVVCEPDEPGSLSSWKKMWEEQLCPTPSPMEETSFRLSWHKEKLPAWPVILAGLDRKSLALAVTVGDSVQIIRTDSQRKSYVAATLEGAKGLVRDVDWANGSMRGFDTIATASKDGFIRIYELHTASGLNTKAAALNPEAALGLPNKRPRSGIGAGLAGSRNDDVDAPGAVRQDTKLVAELDSKTAVWRVRFSFNGDVLLSTGDDAVARMWKKSVDGKWLEAMELDTSKG